MNEKQGVSLDDYPSSPLPELANGCWHWCYNRERSCLQFDREGAPQTLCYENLAETLRTEDFTEFYSALAKFDRQAADDCFVKLHIPHGGHLVPFLLIFTAEPAASPHLIEGMAVSLSRQVNHLGVSLYALALLDLACDGFALFDRRGTLHWQNRSCRELLGMSERQQSRALGRYNLALDKLINEQVPIPDLLNRLADDGQGAAFVVRYPNRKFGAQVVYGQFRVRFLPIEGEGCQGAFFMLLSRAGEHDPLGNLENLSLHSDTQVAIKNQRGFYVGDLRVLNELKAPEFGPPMESSLTDLDRYPAHTAMALRRQGKETLLCQTTLADMLVLSVADKKQDARHTLVNIPLALSGQKAVHYLQLLSPVSAHSLSARKGHDVNRLLNAVRAAICYLDKAGVVREVNQAARQVFGSEPYVNKHFSEYAQGWDDVAERQREIMHVIRTGIAQTDSLESVIQNGRTRWFSVDKVPTHDERGAVTGVLLTMSEVTEQVEQAQSLRDIEARYKAYKANSTDAIWCYELDRPVSLKLSVGEQVDAIAEGARLSQCNDLLLSMLGLDDKSEILGTGLAEVGSQNYFFDIHAFIQNHYQLGDHEIVQANRSGQKIYRQISCVGVVEHGHLVRVWGTTKDITARKRYEEQLAYQANHDSLTQLPNRVRLYKEMEQWLSERKATHQGALLLIDLDRFKEINDTLGHQVGDQLLQLVGPRLEAELSEVTGMVSRLGGDEFAIFLQRIRNPQQAIIIAHRVLDALRQEFSLDGFSTEISASIGVSIAPHQAEDVSTLMRYADVAMYRAKKEMSGLALYNAEYDPHSPKRLAMMSDLGRAIRENQLALYFQPKVNLSSGRCYGVEALLRWFHPSMGFVSPDEFIPIVEMTSLVQPLASWVLEEAIRQACAWRQRGMNLSVAVNLSARNLLDDNLPSLVGRMLKEYGLPGGALDLEITESAIMTDPNRALRNLDELHQIGVGLSVDDFGTGYSSLAYLKRLPIQTLKIDHSFVRPMLQSERDEIIVKSTIQLAHNLEINVVAEGVETAELLERLVSMGCDDAQGYFIGKPMDADAFSQWVADAKWCSHLRSDQ